MILQKIIIIIYLIKPSKNHKNSIIIKFIYKVMNANQYEDIKERLKSSENNLKIANETIKNLLDQISKRANPTILKEENEDLELSHILCIEDIKIYNGSVTKLTEEVKKNKEKLSKLLEENDKIRKEKNLPLRKRESKAYKNFIVNLKDLCKNLGLKVKKNSPNEPKEKEKENINNIKENENKNKQNFERIKRKKEEFDNILNELKNKSNQCNNIIREQNDKINEYRNYLNEVYQFMNNFRERINISVINSVIDNSDNNRKIAELNEQFEISSFIIFDLDDIVFKIKNIFGNNIENLLTDIQTNINDLVKNGYQNEDSFNSICNQINQKNNEIKTILSDFEKSKNDFNSKNRNVEEEIKKLKDLHSKLLDNRRRPNRQNINNSNNNNNNNNNQNVNNNQDINNNRRNRLIEQSFLFNVKNISSKLDLYKTVNLFKQREEDSLDRYQDSSQLLKKNFHEICYVYDDYDIHDIYYDLKAVGLSGGSYFPQANYSFTVAEKIEIQSLKINNVPSEYKLSGCFLSFKVNLNNLESIKIHLKYKSIKDLSRLSQGKKEERKIYRYEYYGLYGDLAGQMAKFSLILKGSFDIVNFDDYFLVRNTNNKNEIEYMWGGCVPEGGKRACIMFSKKEATWSFENTQRFYSGNYIRNTTLTMPIEFIGGNNEIINISPTSPQTTNIIIDEEKRQYIAEFINTRYTEAEFIIRGELRNKCKGEWEVDLTDEEVERLMPREDVQNKAQLKIIAKKIIEEFDRNNRNNDFEYLDYMKIGFWVYKNIKYDYNYVGRTEYSALDIYNMRKGVCHHFTKLSNALLYALGYKVIYICGYVCKESKKFDGSGRHAWSLIKMQNNKWYPFDSTWGILTGKLPVGHIFGTFSQSNFSARGFDSITFDNRDKVNGKFIR